MPMLDQCHEQVVRALQKDGWTVRPTPFYTGFDRRKVFIDIQALQQKNGSAQGIVVVEVKCFLDPHNITTDFYTAIGQYLVYRTILRQTQNAMPLYLAVSEIIFQTVFDETAHLILNESKIKVLVVDMNREKIVRWIE
jgi:XisH protein